MEFPVRLQMGENNWLHTTFRVREHDDDVLIEFGDYISDKFSLFTRIAFDGTDNLRLTLDGPFRREMRFLSAHAVSNIRLYLQKFITYGSIPGKANEFLLNPRKDQAPVEPEQQTISTTLAIRNRKYSKIDPLANLPNIPEPFHFISSSSVTFITFPYSQVNVDNLDHYCDGSKLKSNIILSNLQFDNASYAQIFLKMLPKEIPKYENIRKQWASYTRDQWNLNKNLREFVRCLEFELSLLEGELHYLRQIIFDVYLSCMYRF